MLPILITTSTEIISSTTAIASNLNTNNGNQAWAGAFVAGLQKLGNAIKSFFTSGFVNTDKINENFVNSVNTEYKQLKDLVSSYVPISLSQQDYKYASKLYGTQIEQIVSTITKYNLMNETIKNELEQLSTYERNGLLLKQYRGVGDTQLNAVGWDGGNKTSDWNAYIAPMLTHLMNLGIIDKVEKWDGGEARYYGFIDPSTKVGNILNLINTITTIKSTLSGLLKQIEDLNNKAKNIITNRNLTPLLNGGIRQLPLSNVVVSPTLPRVFGGVDEENTEQEIYGVLLKLYGEALARIIMTNLKVGTLSMSITKTLNKEIEKEPYKKQNNKIPRKAKKRLPKQFKYAERSVANNSAWIEKVSFEFPVVKDYQSNDRGTLIFHLKSGKQIRRVRVERGTFSFIVYAINFVPYGPGYRFWSHFNRKYLVNPNTISIGLRMITNADRQRAIPKELTDKYVKYRS